MVMHHFDIENDIKRRRYKAATRRILVLGIVCVILALLMIVIVLAVTLTHKQDGRKQIHSAAALILPSGNSTMKLQSTSTSLSKGSTAITLPYLSTSASPHHHRSVSSSSVIVKSTTSSVSSSSVIVKSTTSSVSSSSVIIKSTISSVSSVRELSPTPSSVYLDIQTSDFDLASHTIPYSSQIHHHFTKNISPSLESSHFTSMLVLDLQSTQVLPHSSEIISGAHSSAISSQMSSTDLNTVSEEDKASSQQSSSSSSLLSDVMDVSIGTSMLSVYNIKPHDSTVVPIPSGLISLTNSQHPPLHSVSKGDMSLSSKISQVLADSSDVSNIMSTADVHMATDTTLHGSFIPTSYLPTSLLGTTLPPTYVNTTSNTTAIPDILPSLSSTTDLLTSFPSDLSSVSLGFAALTSTPRPSVTSELMSTYTDQRSAIISVSPILLGTSQMNGGLRTFSSMSLIPWNYTVDISSSVSVRTISIAVLTTLPPTKSTIVPTAMPTTVSAVVPATLPITISTAVPANLPTTKFTNVPRKRSTTVPATLPTTKFTVDTTTSSTVVPTTLSTTSSTVVPTSNPCPENQVSCDDGTCLWHTKFCDLKVDCPDGSDESRNCSCGSGQFRCNSGQCVSAIHRCDRFIQCYDKTDEYNCPGCTGFQCGSGLCLWTSSDRCNSVIDCDDLSDEIGCSFRPGYKRCNNGIFILGSDWCNGVDDCYDNSDEIDCACDSQTEVACPEGHCIRQEWKCDGHRDCINGTDEDMCNQCNSTDFVCPDYSCIAMEAVCDGQSDCPGGTDEYSCFRLEAIDTFNVTTGQLWVQHTDQVLPLCSSNWDGELSDVICSYLGHEQSLQTFYFPEVASNDTATTRYFELRSKVISKATSDILRNIRNVTTCANGTVINLSCSPKVCGQRSEDLLTAYIAGGKLAPLGKWPWVVSLTYLGGPLCAASIVTNQWLITAGHCVALPGSHDYIQTPFYIHALAGSVKRLDEQISRNKVIAADRIVQHPNFTWTGLGSILWDIALIHLETPLTFSEVIQPICLSNDNHHGNCYLAGWGQMDSDEGQLPQYLRDAKVNVWSDAECRENTVPLETQVNTNITLCAGYTGGVISGCQGDSGGPLMCEDTRGSWYLAGIMSSGSPACGTTTTRADRFTRLSAVQEWILNIIGSV